MILTLDPSILSSGVALWTPGGRLVYSARIKRPATTDPIAERARRLAFDVSLWVTAHGVERWNRWALVTEIPTVYAYGKEPAAPDAIMKMAYVVGAVAAHATEVLACYKPAEWCGQIPKATKGDPLKSPRGKLVWARLDESERRYAEVQHDALDAVGIGLHHFGRLRRRVLPGAV